MLLMKTDFTLRRIALFITFLVGIPGLSSQAQNFQPLSSYSFGSALMYVPDLYTEMYLDTPSHTWYLDINSPVVQSTFEMDISYFNIDDITGIAYFPNLVKLDVSYNNLTAVPDLSSLRYLDTLNVSYNYLSYFTNPTAPYLRYLDCSHNQITPTLSPYIGSGPSFTSLTYLDCSYNYVGNLNQQLSNVLQYLDCNNNIIQFLPPLPTSLEYLNCSQNRQNTAYPLSSLPALPPRLRHLDCSQNNIHALPSFSDSLRYIDVNDNFFIDTIPVLPALLEYLNCSKDRIAALPPLNSTLRQLICHTQTIWDTSQAGHHGLFSLPALPSGLMVLDCNTNSLDSLPNLPLSLDTLWCNNNRVNAIPALPAHLIDLRCSSNNLTVLLTLPATLRVLDCSLNHLTSLPPLSPDLVELYAQANDIASLSYLPQGIKSLALSQNTSLSCLPRIYQNRLDLFYISGTHIQCMPNRISVYPGRCDIRLDSLPLCDASTGCEFYYNAAGNVHMDTSMSCTLDSIYPGSAVANMKVQLRQGGNVIEQFYTFGSGGYSFKTPSLSNYTITLDTARLPISVTCPQSGARAIALSPADSVKKYESFGMQCSGIDYGIVSMIAGRFRPATVGTMHITAGNMARLLYHAPCGGGVSGTVTISWDNAVTYAGPAPGALTPTTVSGQSLTYNVADLDALTAGSLDILVAIDTYAIAGSYSCFTVSATASQPDVNTTNNTATICERLVNSWDPNYKDVSPEMLHTTTGDWLTYTIHFQNTGSDTAYLVVLKDTLSQYVDAASFQYLASSHHAVIQLDHNAMTFTFPHINLVDSATNPPLSEGWIQYRVRANSNLPNGTAINNTAYIYFDLNPAVVTNTATTTVQLVTCSDTIVNITQAICQGDTFSFYGHALTATGTYNDTLARVGGCDSIISLALVVRPTGYLLITDTICSGEQYIYLHDTLTTSDSAIYIFQNAYGCDSFVQLILSVRAAPVVTFTWDSLVKQHYITYLRIPDTFAFWCPYVFPRYIIPMSGGVPTGGRYTGLYINNDTLDALKSYWALDSMQKDFNIITYTFTDAYGCSNSVHDSIWITFCEGINDLPPLISIHLYPDPNTGTFTLETERSHGLSYRISDILGKEVVQGGIIANQQTVHMPDVAEGVYTISVDGARPIRFVVIR